MATSMGDLNITTDLLHKIEYEDSKGYVLTLNLYTVLANEWRMVCDLIGISIPEQKFIAETYQSNPSMCIRKVMEKWILEKDRYKRYPCTWKGLCSLLNDIKVSGTSRLLEEALKATKSSFVEPDSKTYDASGDGNKPEGDKSQPKGQSEQATEDEEEELLSIKRPRPMQEGEKKKWQITYYSDKKLGHGSNNTIVYKGSFDERSVAVKRLLSENLAFADKEAELLRLSDKHPNVVRYHFIEKQGDFTCIALELGQGTLYDYVNHRSKITGCMNSVDLLEQAMKGLAYLHSIGIVHRDIKPHNVLLSSPSSSGSVKAMISDFGHSRKLPDGKLSFTSSRLGTPGWAAPEVLDNSKRMTFAVDIFSMGCVIYYVLTSGRHPFDPSTHWQANVVDNKYDLSSLSKIDMYTASDLLENMISHDSNSRPTAEKVLCHCLFWSEKKQLEFFQDVSNIIDRKCNNSPMCLSLEKNSSIVCEGDWMNNICGKLKEDLLNYRFYQGSSVAHLLHAIRNKRQHYIELPEELKLILGRIPDEYVRYFTSRFPQLLIHTYKSMETCKEENITKTYYSADFSK